MKPQYEHLTERIREIVEDALPPGSSVLVVSRGDDELLKLEGLEARHFPQSETGEWMGHHPAGSDEAVALLEAMRATGGEFLLFPSTGLWWLEHYEGLNEHLESN